MNTIYINKLFRLSRIGKIIKLMDNNIHNWSINDFEYILNISRHKKYFRIFYYVEFNSLYNDIKRVVNDRGTFNTDRLLRNTTDYKYGNLDMIKYILCSKNVNLDDYKFFRNKDINTSKYLLYNFDIKKTQYMFYIVHRIYDTQLMKLIMTPYIMNKYTYRLDSSDYYINNNITWIGHILSLHLHEFHPILYKEILRNYKYPSEFEYKVRSKVLTIFMHKLLKLSSKYPSIHPKHANMTYYQKMKLQEYLGHTIEGL